MDKDYTVFQSFEGRDDKWVRDFIRWHTEYANEAKQKYDYYMESIARAKAELERRELDAYWQMHPELTRLAVGDKAILPFDFTLGSNIPAEIAEIDIKRECVSFCYWKGSSNDLRYWPDIDFKRASDMRKAYLAQEST